MMLTRRKFQIVVISVTAALSRIAVGQQDEAVTVSIRADDTIRALIPLIAQSNLLIEPDESPIAKELAERAPASKAVPIIFVIVGAIAVTQLLEMINELVKQVYYGGVVIDTRSHPPSITSDPKIPANMVFVIDADGKTTPYTNNRFSLDVLKLALRVR
jgi:hypothetical protein